MTTLSSSTPEKSAKSRKASRQKKDNCERVESITISHTRYKTSSGHELRKSKISSERLIPEGQQELPFLKEYDQINLIPEWAKPSQASQDSVKTVDETDCESA